ncbi:MAG TPA: glycerol-3-phosphate 1-O-acyltransferase PlsY [Acidimicrobiales bacterium]|nr:glycerol-3-phosphate 1-O-acyltransferase PlsY [Acidimicrobiales bacterium]
MDPWALLVVPSYLLGTFPTGLLVGRRHGHDPTAEGSGNPGATNVARVAGRTAGLVVLLVDLAKGAIPAAVGLAVGGTALGLACGAAAVVGHIFPVTRHFRGGKGVATASGTVIVVYPWLSLLVGATFFVTLAVTRRVSAASLAMAGALPIVLLAAGRPAIEVALALAVSLCVVVRHRANIVRLLRGQEPPFTAARSSSAPSRPTREAP